jgi:hypothetical protein
VHPPVDNIEEVPLKTSFLYEGSYYQNNLIYYRKLCTSLVAASKAYVICKYSKPIPGYKEKQLFLQLSIASFELFSSHLFLQFVSKIATYFDNKSFLLS